MSRFRKALLIILLLLLAAVAIEFGARFWLSNVASPEQFARFASYEQLVQRFGAPPLDIHRNIGYAGVAGEPDGSGAHNTLGFRGPEITIPKPAGTFRIVCLGGSATYGAGVSGVGQAYPAQLQAELTARGYQNIEVINAGVLEYSSWENLLNFEFRVLDWQPDLVIVQAGYEDIAARIIWPHSAYREDNSGYLLPPSPFRTPWWERSVALRILAVLAGRAQPYYDLTLPWRQRAPTSYDLELLNQVRNHLYPSGIFREHSLAEILQTNPPTYFEDNLWNLALVAQVNDVPIVFTTTPSYQLFPNDEEIAAVYDNALAEHNAVLTRLAAKMDLPLFDLAAQLPVEQHYFADSTNLSAAGNAEWARLLADFLERENLLR